MDNRPFAVYQLAKDVDIEAVIDRLGKGITGSRYSLFILILVSPENNNG